MIDEFTGWDPFIAVLAYLADANLPPAIGENLQQHRRHLASLAINLKQLGVSQSEIEDHLSRIFAEYEQVLALKLKRLKEIDEALVVVEGNGNDQRLEMEFGEAPHEIS